jgi:SPP1 gp7 family putative phage head morphogenesis protein
MDDYGHTVADGEIEALERRYKDVYGEAAQSVREKAKKYFDDFERKDKEQAALVQSGKLSDRDYRNWRINQMAVGRRWTDFADDLAQEYANANQTAISLANKKLPGVFAANHNYAAYTIEHGTGMNLNFELYDRRTVDRLVQKDPRLLPVKQLDVPKDLRWNVQKVQSAVLQGIIQGESVGGIADRLQDVTQANREAALRSARTCVTGAENAGRLDGYKYAEGIGVRMKKEWLSTLDDKTRASHRLLDGEKAEVDQTFSNGLMYPGDPYGPSSEVYNCRCTMIAAVDDVDEVEPAYRRDNIDGTLIRDMSYNEWHEAKLKAAARQRAAEDATAGKTARLYSGNMAQVIGKQDYDAVMDLVDACESADAQKVWENCQSAIRVANPGTRGTAYCSGQDVYFDIEKCRAGNSIRTPYQTFFHESGHAIDNIAGKAAKDTLLGYSPFYNNGEFQHTIKREVSGWINRVNKQLRTDFQAHAGNYDWLHENGFISDFVYEWYQKTGQMANLPKYTKDYAYRAIEKEMRSLARIDAADLCDMIEGATGAKFRAVAGHGARYWRDRSRGDDCGLAKEAFAEMYSSVMANPGSWAALQKHLPDSCAVFQKMLANMV